MAADGSSAAAAEDRACAVSTRAEVEEALDQNALVMARLQRELDRRKSTFEGDLKRVLDRSARQWWFNDTCTFISFGWPVRPLMRIR